VTKAEQEIRRLPLGPESGMSDPLQFLVAAMGAAIKGGTPMSERTLRRSAAVAGIAFAVLLVVSIVLSIPAPMADKTTAKIVKWYADNREVVFTSGAFGVLSTLAFLWFLGYLYHVLSLLAGPARGLSSIVLASGIYTVTVATVTTLPSAALAITAARPGIAPSEGVVHLLADLTSLSIGLIGVGLAVFLAALGLLLAVGALRPRWATWVAYVGAVLSLVGGVSAFFVSKSGKGNPLGIGGLLGTVLFLIVVVAVSLDLLQAPAIP
jgi:hypothetical protein